MMNPRRITLTLGAAAGGLLAAALIPMATASADPDDFLVSKFAAPDLDPYSDLELANGPALDAITPAGLANPFDMFVDASGINYVDNDFFADLLGPSGASIDSLFVNLDLGPWFAVLDTLSGL